MKVLSVISYYHPHWTGLTSYAVYLAEGLAARGHRVTILTSRHSRELVREETLNGVRIVRLWPLTRFSRAMVCPGFPLSAMKLVACHDVVQVHTPLPESLFVALFCRLLNRPLMMIHHGDVVMPAGLVNRALEGVAFHLLRMTASLASVITSYGMDYAEHSRLLRPFLGRVVALPPPVRLPLPAPERAAEWRRRLGLADKRIVGIAGRWVQEKGYEYLLKAMPHVRKVFHDAHVVFAGETNVAYEDTYERCFELIESQKEHVTLLGLQRERQTMADFYAMCDVLALPSCSDMFALVQVEALCCGTPVVATDVPGARVVVRETGFGRLVSPRDPSALARGITEILSEPEHYRPVVERVRSLFDEKATVDLCEKYMTAAWYPRGALHSVPTITPTRRSKHAWSWRSSSSGRRELLWSSLDERDHIILSRVLRNEADMAYRRRVRVLLDYLELRDGDRVLDCGCGMGFYLLAMSRLRRLALVGLDGARRRLSLARDAGIHAGLACSDLFQMPFVDACFDSVLLTEVLEHLPNPRRALEEIHRVLRPGGVLAISVPHASYPFWWDPFNRLWTSLGGKPLRNARIAGIWSNHEFLYRPDELAMIVEGTGFDLERVEESTHYAFPFNHFLVYGIGRPLLEHNVLPQDLRRSADRLRGEESSDHSFNPVHVGIALFRTVDRHNETARVESKTTFVNVLLKARKPPAS